MAHLAVVGHLNSHLARGGGNLNINFATNSNGGGVSRGMLKFPFDKNIMTTKMVRALLKFELPG